MRWIALPKGKDTRQVRWGHQKTLQAAPASCLARYKLWCRQSHLLCELPETEAPSLLLRNSLVSGPIPWRWPFQENCICCYSSNFIWAPTANKGDWLRKNLESYVHSLTPLMWEKDIKERHYQIIIWVRGRREKKHY